MRRIPVLIVAAGLAASAVGAQTPSDSAASKSALLTLDQKTKIPEMITERTPPLEGGSFPVSVDGVVPSDVQLNSLPSEAEQLAPNFAVSATLSSKSWLPSLIRGPARWKSCSRGGGSHSPVCHPLADVACVQRTPMKDLRSHAWARLEPVLVAEKRVDAWRGQDHQLCSHRGNDGRRRTYERAIKDACRNT